MEKLMVDFLLVKLQFNANYNGLFISNTPQPLYNMVVGVHEYIQSSLRVIARKQIFSIILHEL